MIEILIVDKDMNLAASLVRATDTRHIRVDVAQTEADALAAMRAEPALVFVRTRGWRAEEIERLIGRIRSREPSVPVAVIASGGSAADEVSLRRLGILCYLQEPVSTHLVREVVRGAASWGSAFGRGGTRAERFHTKQGTLVQEECR